MGNNLFKEIKNVNKKWVKEYFFPKRESKFALSTFSKNYLENYPAFTEGKINFGNVPFQFSHALSFWHSYEEIFKENIYKFNSETESPFIIDCGANIGLSVLYFKLMYPNSQIIAFEPDEAIFSILEKNILQTWQFNNVSLHKKAVWIEDGTLDFFVEGALAGSIVGDFGKTGKKITVETVDLKKFLIDKEVDFLKIDIEGAENTLIFDIASQLKNVNNLFIEYHSITKESQKLGEILQVLTNAGFRYHIQEAYHIPSPFLQRTTSLFDLQLNIFCRKI